MSMRWATIIPVIALTLALLCLTQSEDAGADPAPMVEKPTELGPYPQGYYDTSFRASTKSYDTQLRVFYPATGAGGRGAGPNASAAPYITVVWLPFYGGTFDMMDFQAGRLASYGAAVVVFGVNWSDFQNSGGPQDMEDLLDLLEDLNATTGNTLTGMVDKEAFGVCGYSSGGGLSLVDGAFVDRFKAVQAWAVAIGTSTINSIAPLYSGKPVMLQVGQDDGAYIANSRRAYQAFGMPKSLIETIGAGHGGPFLDHAYISFFLYNLAGHQGHWTHLYGDGALEDVAAGDSVTYFRVSADLFYPPALAWTVSDSTVQMDEEITFNVTWSGYFGQNVAGLEHQYDVDGDLDPEVTGHGMPNVTYAFTSAGAFDVVYTYRLGAYARSLSSKRVVVSNVLPVAHAGPDVIVKHDGSLGLTGSGSQDSPSDIPRLLYMWEFSDGFVRNFSADPNVTRSFNSVKVLVATLTVRDPHGGVDTDVANITVENVAPTVDAGWYINTTEDTVLGFSGRGNDTISHRRDLEYRWDFGDGFSTSWSNDPEVRHAYTRAGIYNVTMMVRDPEGANGSDVGWVNVSNMEPMADVLAPLDGARFTKDKEVEFKALGRDTASDVDGLMFRWEFGDGNGTGWVSWSDADTTHVYGTGGTYTVTLWVVDDDGAEVVSTLKVLIENTPPTAEIILPLPTSKVNEDSRVTFSGAGTDTASDIYRLSYTWEILGRTLEGETVHHTFSGAGTYQVNLTVTDPEGLDHVASVMVTVVNLAPTVEAQLEPTSIEVNGSVEFSSTVFDTPSDMEGLRLVWDWGDGTTSNDASGTHVYTTSGTFTVNLTVTDDDGSSAYGSWTVRVTEPPPEQPYEPPVTPDVDDSGDTSSWLYLVVIALCLIIIVLFWVFRERMFPDGGSGPDREEER